MPDESKDIFCGVCLTVLPDIVNIPSGRSMLSIDQDIKQIREELGNPGTNLREIWSSVRDLEGKEDIGSPVCLFGSVGRAILPFARSVILIMRACSHAIKARKRRKGDLTNETHILPAKLPPQIPILMQSKSTIPGGVGSLPKRMRATTKTKARNCLILVDGQY